MITPARKGLSFDNERKVVLPSYPKCYPHLNAYIAYYYFSIKFFGRGSLPPEPSLDFHNLRCFTPLKTFTVDYGAQRNPLPSLLGSFCYRSRSGRFAAAVSIILIVRARSSPVRTIRGGRTTSLPRPITCSDNLMH